MKMPASHPMPTIGSAFDKSLAIARRHPIAATALATLAVSALVNRQLATKAEGDNPPIGSFLEIAGVRLHYFERGKGQPLLLLHGNGSMIEDFKSSGLIELAAQNYRVIAFDRPGFGHTTRPRITVWTPQAQSKLLKIALERLGVGRALVLGHSWGASVAIALALDYPELVEGLVLVSGYYFPTPRLDVVGLSLPAIPLLGDLASLTLAPIATRAMWPRLMHKIFGPCPVPEKFVGFPKEMAVRPTQLRASAAESALMIPDALHYSHRYSQLKMPVSIVAGENDRLINIEEQSARLHESIPRSSFHRIPGTGHMVHQTSTELLMSVVHQLASRLDG